jgi:hypothetical protein
MPAGSAVACRVSSSVAIGCKRQSAMQVQTRCPWAEECAPVREQACLLKGPGQASARPEELPPAARRYLVRTTLWTVDRSPPTADRSWMK